MAENAAEVRPEEIVEDVRRVLQGAARGKGPAPNYLTAYQILNRLPADIRMRLVADHGRGGRGEGHHYAATGVVKNALKRLINENSVEIVYLDTGGLQLIIDGEPVEAGNRVCALYRVRV